MVTDPSDTMKSVGVGGEHGACGMYLYVIASTRTARPSSMHSRRASLTALYSARMSFPSTRMVWMPYPGPRAAMPSP